MARIRAGLDTLPRIGLTALSGLGALILFATTIAVAAGLVLGTSIIVVFPVGLPLLVGMLRLVRAFASAHRRWVARFLDTAPIRERYAPPVDGPWVLRFLSPLRDLAVWRDLGWIGVHAFAAIAAGLGPIGLVGLGTYAIVGPFVASWLDGVPASWAFLPSGVIALVVAALLGWHGPGMVARMDRRMLAPGQRQSLAAEVEHLQRSRAAVVDAREAEIQRIERDLHDGAQARLAAVALDLGLVDSLFERDPDAARELVRTARVSTQTALSELRDLVRGVRPPVLADRGLAGALAALAVDSAVPVDLEVAAELEAPGRVPAPIESAVYFAAAEGLANVLKHAGAGRASIRLSYADGQLHMVITDDGVGGADPSRGTGLAGIERRIDAFDGAMALSSPAGGPTRLVVEVPCALSSPKITPSSATD